MSRKRRELDLEVEGGRLHAAVWDADGPTVLCSHGITANHVSFEALADALGPGVRVIAPDHRGRGGSRGISGPWGMEAHAADLVALLDAVDVDHADVLVGHSMGGFVAAVTAALHPDRVGTVVLIDGGLPLFEKLPEGVTIEQLVHAVIGPAMERLDRTFESREAYRDFWRDHPALESEWSEWIERYLDYDLVEDGGAFRASTVKAAVLGDAESQLTGDLVPRALESLRGPVRFLRAPRGIMNGDPLYVPETLDGWSDRVSGFSHATIPDVNHYTIVISPAGAEAVRREVEALLPSNRRR